MFISVCENFCPLSFQLLNCLHFFNGFEQHQIFHFFAYNECFLHAHISAFAKYEVKRVENEPIKGIDQ